MDLDTLSDLRTPWCIHVVATLGVADRLTGGAQDVDTLADACAADPDALLAVLRHLAAKGVFEEIAPRRFALNDLAAGLLDPVRRIGLDLEGIGGRVAP